MGVTLSPWARDALGDAGQRDLFALADEHRVGISVGAARRPRVFRVVLIRDYAEVGRVDTTDIVGGTRRLLERVEAAA